MHNFKYTLKTLFKSKILIFWTFLFPLVLGTFFHLAFSDIEENETYKTADIAIVNNQSYQENEVLKEAFNHLSEENDDKLFNIIYAKNEKEAAKLLENDEVIGYLYITEKINIIVKESGIYQTIFKFATDEIVSMTKVYEDIVNKKINDYLNNNIEFESLYQKIYEEVTRLRNDNQNFTNDISRSNLSYTMIEYYTLIAMTCLYGGIIGMSAINKVLPNMSCTGKRMAVAPEKKISLIFSSALASFIVELIGLSILFIYTTLVLHVDYGNNLPLIILLSLAGTFVGLSLGIFVASIIKTNENNKTGILIALTMLGCYLSGMMGITMKYVVDVNAPILTKINPAAIITDGFYALYYYDSLDRYFINLISLIIIALILLLISSISLRRQKYDNI